MGGSGVSDDLQCVQVAPIGTPAHLDTASNIHDAFTHSDPGHFLLPVAGHAAPHFKARRVVDGGLDSHYGACLVVHFDRVLFDPMLDADAFHTRAHGAADFSFKPTVDAPA